MKASDRLVGFIMDRKRSESLRVLAVRRNMTTSRLIREALESAYGKDLDSITTGLSSSTVSNGITKRKVR